MVVVTIGETGCHLDTQGSCCQYLCATAVAVIVFSPSANVVLGREGRRDLPTPVAVVSALVSVALVGSVKKSLLWQSQPE